jgi:hypothetical protein
MPTDEEIAEESDQRVAALVNKIGEVMQGSPMHDGIDAACMVLANLCADTETPGDHLVDAIAFLTEFFRDITGSHHGDDEGDEVPEEPN